MPEFEVVIVQKRVFRWIHDAPDMDWARRLAEEQFRVVQGTRFLSPNADSFEVVAIAPFKGGPVDAELECLDGPEGCEGPVEPRTTDGLRFWPRCEKHFEARLDREERIRELTSDIEPDWFDPLAAGERWDEDY